MWAFPVPATLLTRASARPLILGRGEDCDAILQGAETSRHHAELSLLGSLWVLRDLGSTNGCYVNGTRVEQAPLSVGDVVRLGEWLGIVRNTSLATPAEELRFSQLAPRLYGGARLKAALGPVRRVAKGMARIVIEGETGTGKEQVARAIHYWSGRPGKFLGINCAALSTGIVEAELFGHRKGAFTGADRASLGYFRAADGGTLLLDEITEMPLHVQSKLLRALEERAVVPLGESTPIPVDVRVLAASQEPLEAAVADKRFRADLCARLSGLTVVLPPLRERTEDVPSLFATALERHLKRPAPAVQATMVEQLCLHDWAFNVRELDQLAGIVAELHGDEPVLRSSHLTGCLRRVTPAGASRHSGAGAGTEPDEPRGRAGFGPREEDKESDEERRVRELLALKGALERSEGNLARAAGALGISRQKAYRLLERLPADEMDAALRRGAFASKKQRAK